MEVRNFIYSLISCSILFIVSLHAQDLQFPTSVESSISENIRLTTSDSKLNNFALDDIEEIEPEGEELEQRHYQSGAQINYNLTGQPDDYTLDFGYHNYDRMTKYLRSTTGRFPRLTALYSIGKSVQGM